MIRWPFHRKVVAVVPVVSRVFDCETGEFNTYLKWKVIRE